MSNKLPFENRTFALSNELNAQYKSHYPCLQ